MNNNKKSYMKYTIKNLIPYFCKEKINCIYEEISTHNFNSYDLP